MAQSALWLEKSSPSYRIGNVHSRRGAFGVLFRHIQRRGIPMTAPVEMARDEGQSMMGFMYEDTRQGVLVIKTISPLSILEKKPS